MRYVVRTFLANYHFQVFPCTASTCLHCSAHKQSCGDEIKLDCISEEMGEHGGQMLHPSRCFTLGLQWVRY